MAEIDPKAALATMTQGAPKTIRAEGHKTLYVNGIKIAMSPWDLRIVFSNTTGASMEESITEEVVTVVMSPQQAKSSLQHWANSVRTYENTFGPIPEINSILETVTKENLIKALSAESPKQLAEKTKRRTKVRR